MGLPLVSVLVPSYNHARYLREALEAVRLQTYPEWELIFVDDGSSDGSIQLASELGAGDPRIQVHQNEINLGTYGTLEKARLMAKGRFLAVLNSDDRWEARKLEAQVKLMEAHPECVYSYTLGWTLDVEGALDQRNDVHGDWPTGEIQNPLPYLLHENRVLASSVLFRSEGTSFEPTLRYSGDWLALLQASRRGSAACVGERLSHWRIHGANSYTRSVNQVVEEVRLRRAILDARDSWFGHGPTEREIRNGLGKNALHLAALEVLRCNRSAAIRYALQAVKDMEDKKAAVRRYVACLLPNAKQFLWPNEEMKFKSQEPPKLQV